MASRTAAAGLASLPYELLRLVARGLSLRDLFRLRGLCRSVGPAFSHLFVERLKMQAAPKELVDLLRSERGALRVVSGGTSWHLHCGPLRPVSAGRLLRAAGFGPHSETARAVLGWFMDESVAAASLVADGMGMQRGDSQLAGARALFPAQLPAPGADLAEISDTAARLRTLMRRAGFPEADAPVGQLVEAALANADARVGAGAILDALGVKGRDAAKWCREELASGAVRIFAWAGLAGPARCKTAAEVLMWMVERNGAFPHEVGRCVARSNELTAEDKARVLAAVLAGWKHYAVGAIRESLDQAGTRDAARAIYNAMRSEPALLSYAIIHVLLHRPDGSVNGIDLRRPLGPVGEPPGRVPAAAHAAFAESFASFLLHAKNKPCGFRIREFLRANGLCGAPVWIAAAAAARVKARGEGIKVPEESELEVLLR
ncbi:hypothetical protein DFJ74DRAFT_736314 [Hyaloraphidium curvatum]|nr:hypothetical protein DFJ74DRAFT_736314 [Hyaloraphidium curvatum]